MARRAVVLSVLMLMYAALSAGSVKAVSQCRCSWTSAGSMHQGRENAASTTLADGRVLVAGGHAGGAEISSAEVYDPQTDTWTSAGSLAIARSYATASLLPNGKVLVAGGLGNGRDQATLFPGQSELYDPIANSWSSGGMMIEGRFLHTATLLSTGAVLVTGGDSFFLGAIDSERYDPTTNSWSLTARPPVAVREATATRLSNGTVLVAGGGLEDLSGTGSLTNVQIYDPRNDSWRAAAPMATARRNHTATSLPGGSVLVVGGLRDNANQTRTILSSAEVYNPRRNEWTTVGSLLEPRELQTATTLRDGSVLLVGGVGCTAAGIAADGTCTYSSVFGNDNGLTLSTTEVYDRAHRRWAHAASTLKPRAGHSAALLRSGQVLVVGGSFSINDESSAEILGRVRR